MFVLIYTHLNEERYLGNQSLEVPSISIILILYMCMQLLLLIRYYMLIIKDFH